MSSSFLDDMNRPSGLCIQGLNWNKKQATDVGQTGFYLLLLHTSLNFDYQLTKKTEIVKVLLY